LEITEKTVSELIAGNQQAFDLIFKTYYIPLCNFSMKIVKDKESAEEIVQDLFVTVWEKHQKLKINVSIKSYLYRSVANNSVRYVKKRNLFISNDTMKNLETEFESDSSEIIALVEMEEKIHGFIRQLPPKCQEIFKMSRFEEFKYNQIAEKLNISIKTVEAQITKAIKFLHENVKKL